MTFWQDFKSDSELRKSVYIAVLNVLAIVFSIAAVVVTFTNP